MTKQREFKVMTTLIAMIVSINEIKGKNEKKDKGRLLADVI